jgi:hypothetical protein
VRGERRRALGRGPGGYVYGPLLQPSDSKSLFLLSFCPWLLRCALKLVILFVFGGAGLARDLAAVLRDDALRQRLQRAARETALRYSLSGIADRLEELLYCAVAARDQLLQLRQHPLAVQAAHRACVAAINAATIQAQAAAAAAAVAGGL